MTADFDRALQHVLGMEGGYSDHPADRGGKTRYGVTEAVARRHGYHGSMAALPLELAKRIYRKDYWDPFDLDAIPDHAVASKLFDLAVNTGGGGMARIAQRAASHRKAIAVDGKWGPKTRNTLIGLSRSSPENLLGALRLEQGRYYLAIVEKRPTNRAFLWGWMKRI